MNLFKHAITGDIHSCSAKLAQPIISQTKEMLKIAIKNKPNFVCIVPEKRREITTEGGLNIKTNNHYK